MSPHLFPIVSVDDFPRYREEYMGTKEKYWFVQGEPPRRPRQYSHWLFKYSQQGTGQDWAEKLACELAAALDLPHAHVELASYREHRGCVVKSVLVSRASDVLVHGNELLYEHDPTYEKEKRSPSTHTVDRVLRALDATNIRPPHGARWTAEEPLLSTASEWFVGYLLLDALIGNTDRHHENWAIIQSRSDSESTPQRMLAPTFDHGSSLSRELRDEERARRLEGWAHAGVIYANRARSGLYETQADKKPVHPLKAFRLAAEQKRAAAEVFLERLKSVQVDAIEELLERIPEERMSKESKRFVSLLLRHNRTQIIEVQL